MVAVSKQRADAHSTSLRAGSSRTPKVPRLRDEMEEPSLWISHEVLWSAMRLRIFQCAISLSMQFGSASVLIKNKTAAARFRAAADCFRRR